MVEGRMDTYAELLIVVVGVSSGSRLAPSAGAHERVGEDAPRAERQDARAQKEVVTGEPYTRSVDFNDIEMR